MANEMVQGLLQNLLQPQQGPAPADIMAALSSRNPMAAVSAMQAPQLSQMFGQQFRGLIGGLRGQPAAMTGNEAYTQAVQQLSAQPDFMNTSDSLAKLAAAASAVGRTPEAMQFSMLASQAKAQEAERNKAITSQSLQRNTNINAVGQAIASVDAAKYPGLSNALEGYKNQLSSEQTPSDPDKIQTTLNNLFERYKVDKEAQTGMTQYQTAELYKSFTADSIRAHLANPNSPLVPLDKEAQTLSPNTLSTLYSQYTPESVQAFVSNNNAILVPRPERAKELSPAEEVNMLDTAINRNPTYSKTADNIAQLQQVIELKPLLDSNNPQAFTVISAVLPQLVGSNSRAQAEIDAFRSRVGIKESIGDWAAKLTGGTATQETKNNLAEIINILDANFTAQRQRELDQVVNNFKGVISEERLNNWKANLMSDLTPDSIESIVNRALNP